MPSLTALWLSGSGNVFAAGVDASHLVVAVPGSGNVSASGTATSLDVSITGSGNAQLVGLRPATSVPRSADRHGRRARDPLAQRVHPGIGVDLLQRQSASDDEHHGQRRHPAGRRGDVRIAVTVNRPTIRRTGLPYDGG